MSWRASWAIARHELRVMSKDPSTAVFVIVMPLAMAALMKGLFRDALAGQGVTGATGAEFAVPGMAVAFAAFGVGFSGFAFFRDHGWGTWERLRASPATSVDILVGKVVPAVALTLVQVTLLFLLGGPLLGFRVAGPVVALVPVIVVLALCLNAFGVAVTAMSRTSQQLNAVGSAGGFLLAILGGAFVPVETMPGWAQAVAPGVPTYWAMRAFRDVILDGEGLASTALPSAMMLVFAVGFVALAATRFRFDEPKVYYG